MLSKTGDFKLQADLSQGKWPNKCVKFKGMYSQFKPFHLNIKDKKSFTVLKPICTPTKVQTLTRATSVHVHTHPLIVVCAQSQWYVHIHGDICTVMVVHAQSLWHVLTHGGMCPVMVLCAHSWWYACILVLVKRHLLSFQILENATFPMVNCHSPKIYAQ